MSSVSASRSSCAQKDRTDQLGALYQEHKQEVFALALRYGAGNASFAEDIMQEVFLQLVLSIDDLEATDALGGWLYRVTTRRCMNRLRKERFRGQVRRFLLAPEPTAEEALPDSLVSTQEEASAVFAGLARLPPKERIAFCAYHLDEKSQQAIGEIVGHSKSYVCKLIRRAEERLRKEVEPVLSDYATEEVAA